MSKAVARAIWYMAGGRTDIERLIGYTYNGLLNDWFKKNGNLFTKEDLEIIKSDSFDGTVIFKCKMIISQNYPSKHQDAYDAINAEMKES